MFKLDRLGVRMNDYRQDKPNRGKPRGTTREQISQTAPESTVTSAFERHESALMRFFRRVFPFSHDVDDLTQEVFLRAFEAEKNKKIQHPKAFLFGVARKLALKKMSKKSRAIISQIEDYDGSEDIVIGGDHKNEVEWREEWKKFAEATATLPERCRQVFILKKVYGLSNKAIAKRLDISLSTVEKHIASGLKKCRAALDAQERGMPASGDIRRIAEDKATASRNETD